MAKPYGRIFLQQFLVIFGIIIINALEANAGTVFILMLVAMKTAADAAMHRRSHREEAAGDT